MTRAHWIYPPALLAVAAWAPFGPQLAVLCLTVGIFFGTVSLRGPRAGKGPHAVDTSALSSGGSVVQSATHLKSESAPQSQLRATSSSSLLESSPLSSASLRGVSHKIA